jgi:tetratricopeptide (TPR) repeat protein
MGSWASEPPAAGSPSAALAAEADSAYRLKDWGKAVPLYERLVQQQPDGYLNRLRLAVCLHGVGRNAQALAAYETAQVHGAPASAVQYGEAIVFASIGEHEKALTALSEAVGQGHGRPDLMLAEPDLRTLRSDPKFADIAKQAQQNQAPCQYRSESRQFDFWVGDWSVVTTRELTPVGRSHIERTIGACVIWENWTSLGESGYSGKSYNVYNPDQKRWEQFWVDNQGGMIHFHGSYAAGVMDFYTDEVPQADGKTLKRRLRFYNLGADQVRQFSEGSPDGGKTWTVEYDFTYQREKNAGPSGSRVQAPTQSLCINLRNARTRLAFAPTSLSPTRDFDLTSMREPPSLGRTLTTTSSLKPKKVLVSVASRRPSAGTYASICQPSRSAARWAAASAVAGASATVSGWMSP